MGKASSLFNFVQAGIILYLFEAEQKERTGSGVHLHGSFSIGFVLHVVDMLHSLEFEKGLGGNLDFGNF